ncbi:hypothetical protein E1301_Tti014784 [Triplophysa tibetana]|uniref:Uncharacterized protein n=1 Tax=Triplophysa tibetana TaxID=1572043 RepID=A0A5A9PRN5_9TELE|nr:hypothetical protein E1301_Tti014784 [Triplophysa tibetana]
MPDVPHALERTSDKENIREIGPVLNISSLADPEAGVDPEAKESNESNPFQWQDGPSRAGDAWPPPAEPPFRNLGAPTERPDTSAEIWKLTGSASGRLHAETGSGDFDMTRGKANLTAFE